MKTEAVAAPGPITNVTVFREVLGLGATAAGQDPASAVVVQRGEMTLVAAGTGDSLTSS